MIGRMAHGCCAAAAAWRGGMSRRRLLLWSATASAQLDPLLFLKRVPPTVIIVVDTSLRMLEDGNGNFYDPNTYSTTADPPVMGRSRTSTRRRHDAIYRRIFRTGMTRGRTGQVRGDQHRRDRGDRPDAGRYGVHGSDPLGDLRQRHRRRGQRERGQHASAGADPAAPEDGRVADVAATATSPSASPNACQRSTATRTPCNAVGRASSRHLRAERVAGELRARDVARRHGHGDPAANTGDVVDRRQPRRQRSHAAR